MPPSRRARWRSLANDVPILGERNTSSRVRPCATILVSSTTDTRARLVLLHVVADYRGCREEISNHLDVAPFVEVQSLGVRSSWSRDLLRCGLAMSGKSFLFSTRV